MKIMSCRVNWISPLVMYIHSCNVGYTYLLIFTIYYETKSTFDIFCDIFRHRYFNFLNPQFTIVLEKMIQCRFLPLVNT